MSLQSFFEKYNQSGIYPFHMPGHKRRGASINAFDYTEVDNLDDLYNADGILKELQEKISRLYGTLDTFILVNGSTVGILTAITAAVGRGEEILIARNCHKSVYNAAFLWDLKPRYILPEGYNGMFISVNPEEAERKLTEFPGIRAVVVTSPTYEGAVSDIRSLAETCHAHNAVLIVDEAHGSHFKFSGYFPDSAVDCGADLVVQSVHKTLPALTGTALLHICSVRVPVERIKNRLQAFQTSSPSYILMNSVDNCYNLVEKDGERLFSEYINRLEEFYNRAKKLQKLCIYKGESAFDFDRGKLVIMTDRAAVGGTELQKLLSEKYKLETEMSSLNYVIAMTSIADTDEGFERLSKALEEIDDSLEFSKKSNLFRITIPDYRISVYEAECKKNQLSQLDEAEGKIAAEYIYAYPPGSPLIVPGELISREVISAVKIMTANGVRIISSGFDVIKTIEGE